ncbi:hypothetical protein PLEOSDRAFT_1081473 [Pleurotus ostreatus PC15]|uniref:Uncharacterized protein n=1 Tax=Pleurotus ostreatus (strain PC15) TaxID=1137138 RepID=A0A067NWB2_PLEO1|nr:hypothetical protein PLEOSDRAFT_1081473 [Pleurotus ostreatus PC15]
MTDLLPILVHILHILRLSFYAIRASVAVTMAFLLWLLIMRPARATMHVYRGIRDVWKKHYAQKDHPHAILYRICTKEIQLVPLRPSRYRRSDALGMRLNEIDVAPYLSGPANDANIHRNRFNFVFRPFPSLTDIGALVPIDPLDERTRPSMHPDDYAEHVPRPKKNMLFTFLFEPGDVAYGVNSLMIDRMSIEANGFGAWTGSVLVVKTRGPLSDDPTTPWGGKALVENAVETDIPLVDNCILNHFFLLYMSPRKAMKFFDDEQEEWLKTKVDGFEQSMGKEIKRKLWYATLRKEWSDRWDLKPEQLHLKDEKRGSSRVTEPATRSRTRRSGARTRAEVRELHSLLAPTSRHQYKRTLSSRGDEGLAPPSAALSSSGTPNIALDDEMIDQLASDDEMIDQLASDDEMIDQLASDDDGNTLLTQTPCVRQYDIQDTSTSLLEIDMPGVSANDVSLLLDDGRLVVHGRTEFRGRVWSYQWEGHVDSSIPAEHFQCGMQYGRLGIAWLESSQPEDQLPNTSHHLLTGESKSPKCPTLRRLALGSKSRSYEMDSPTDLRQRPPRCYQVETFKAAVHVKPGVEPNERQSPKLDRQDSSKSEDQLPPLPANGPESSEHSPPPFDSFNADEKSPPLVNSELTPPAELPPLPDGLELDQPSPRPVDSSGPDDKPPPAELPLIPDGFEPDQPLPPPVDGSGSDDKSPTAELAPPPDGFKPDQPSHRPADSSGSDDKPPPPGKLPPLPDSFESDEESPSVVDSEFTPASDDSSTSQATLIPRGKCNIPSISASPERTPDDMKALEPNDALLLSPARLTAPALPAAVAPDIQQGCCPQGPDVLRVVESFEASSKAETLEHSTHSFLLQEELHGAKRIIANLAETSERCANSNVTSIITRQQAMEIDIATLKQETSSLHDRRTAIVLEDRLDEIAQLNQAQKQAAQQNEQMTRELEYLRRDYETEVQKAMHRVELLATENKAIRAQNSEIASIAVNQASKSNIGALQCEGARLQEERSWVGDKVSELISKCAAYEVENVHLHTQVSESISKYAAYEMEIGRIRTEVSDSSSKCAAYEVQNARLHTQVQSPEGVQAEVTQSETETYGDQSSDSSIQSPPSVNASHDEEAPSQEIHVVSGKQEYGSDDAAPQLLSTSSELPIFEAHGPPHDSDGAQNGDHTPLSSPPQTPAFKAFNFTLLTPSPHDRSLIGPLSPMSPLTSSPDGSPVRRNVRVKQLASTSTSSRRTQSGTRSISNNQNSGQLPKASMIMSPRRTRSSMRLTSNNRICNQLAPGGSLTSKRKATSNSSAAPKKRRRTGFAASGVQRRLATPEELLCDDFKNTFISDLMEEGDTEMPGSYPATPFASSHNQKAVNNPDCKGNLKTANSAGLAEGESKEMNKTNYNT